MAGQRNWGGHNDYRWAAEGSVLLGTTGEPVNLVGNISLNGVDVFSTDIVQSVLLTTAVDGHIFIAPRAVQLISFEVIYAAAQGSAATLDLKKCTGTTAPASGTTMLAAAVNLNTTINTTITAGLSATPANLLLADGDKAALDWSTAIGSLAGAVATIVWRPTA